MKGQVVVITGASAGVGRAAAEAFSAEGARVALIARGEEGLADVCATLRHRGGKALAVACDVAVADEVARAAKFIETSLGPIDVWINNAMTAVFKFVAETPPEEYRRVTEVTYLGAVNGTLAALARMRERDRGTIIQVSSALAYRGILLQSSYSAAKHALKGFTESLQGELMHQKSAVKVTMVALPGMNTTQFDWVRTNLGRQPQPVRPIYQPEVAARALLWAAAHPARRELQVGWPTVATIKANALAPALFTRWLANTNVEAQLAHELISPDRPDYLFRPVQGRHGAHGRFDDIARSHSAQLWLATHRTLTAGAAASAIALLIRATSRRGAAVHPLTGRSSK